MSHRSQKEGDGSIQRIAYEWIFKSRKNYLELCAKGEAGVVQAGSCEEFITEHYWGYARQCDKGTVEYQVEHPRWRVWAAHEATLDCQVVSLYGKTFAGFLGQAPSSAFLADGSPVTVFKGTRLAQK